MIDLQGVDALVDGFERKGRVVFDEVVKVNTVAGFHVRDDARAAVEGLAHAPHYPRAITFDLRHGLTYTEVEIGPDKDLPQGPLGNLINYGSANNPPNPHIEPAADREEPRWHGHMERIAGDVF